jgi:ubiquinone/menaquinone biosynthesis C-methylase UbiE
MITYDALAEHYADRAGYSSDLYNTLLGFGLTPRHHVLDLGCGTGLGSRPLVESEFRVTGLDQSKRMIAAAREQLPRATWIEGLAEAMPFPAAEFDAAICAQSFHRFDKTKAFDELVRVLRPRSLVAIWWKVLMNDDPVRLVRDAVAREFGIESPAEGLSGGFKEFYAAPLTDQTLRVVPWHVMTPLRSYLQYERSRLTVHEALGLRTKPYFDALEARLQGEGSGTVALSYLQFVYVARTPQR